MSQAGIGKIVLALAIVAAWIALLAATKPDPKESAPTTPIVKVDPLATANTASTQEPPKSPECMAASNELLSVKTDLVFVRVAKTYLHFRSQRHPDVEDIVLDCSLPNLSLSLSFSPDSDIRDDDIGRRAPLWFHEMAAKYGSVLTGVAASRLKEATVACVRLARSPKNGDQWEISGKNFIVTCALGTSYGGATSLEIVQKK